MKLLAEDLYLQVRLYRYQAERRTDNRTSAAWREHRDIVEALRARDPDRAAAAMERHIANAMSALNSDIEV
jgi:DNA-binding GntR family transcriptional regulator